MDKNRKDLALYIIDLKIAKETKNNTEKDYEKFKEKIVSLKKEKDEVYKDNEQMIEKILSKYLKEVK